MIEYFITPAEGESYSEYIEHILSTRDNVKIDNVYMERHHIIPRCCGGVDDKSNLIWLYPQEHYYCHKLLALENPHHQGLVYAWWGMSHEFAGRKYTISADEFAYLREFWTTNRTGEKHPNSKAVICLETNKVYGGVRECARDIGCSPSSVSATCLHTRDKSGRVHNTIHGLHYLFLKDATVDNIAKTLKLKIGAENIMQKVKCVETGKIYDSITQAAKEINRADSGVRACLYGRCETAGKSPEGLGYHWEYVIPEKL